jgi:hypothetical protein
VSAERSFAILIPAICQAEDDLFRDSRASRVSARER